MNGFFSRNTCTILVMTIATSSLWCSAQTEQQVLEKQRLQRQLAERKAALEQTRSEQVAQKEQLTQAGDEALLRLQELEQRKGDLQTLLSERERKISQYLEASKPPFVNPFDTVTFSSGREVTCSVVSYSGGQFRLEDQKGDSLHILPGAVASIQLRSSAEADVFPAHTVNKGPVQRTRLPATMTAPVAPAPVGLKEYMFTVRMSRSHSRENTNIIVGYVDEVTSDVQYTCIIEPRGLTEEVDNLRVKIWVLAEDVLRKNFYKLVLHTDKRFTMPIRGKVEIETDTVRLDYDDAGGARYGHKLYGYVMMLEDPDGNVILSKRNKKKLMDHLEKIEKMSLNEEVRL